MKAQLQWDRHVAQMDTKTPRTLQKSVCQPGLLNYHLQKGNNTAATWGKACAETAALGKKKPPGEWCQIHLSTLEPNLKSILIKTQSHSERNMLLRLQKKIEANWFDKDLTAKAKNPTCAPDGWTMGQAAAIGTIPAVCYSSYGLLPPGICQWGPVNEVVVLPCYKFITRGDCYADLSDPLLITEQEPSGPFFMAKEQMLQQDVKSSSKCHLCTESSTFKGWGITFVLG